MTAYKPKFFGQSGEYVATDFWHESRLTRVLLGINQATGDEVVIKVSRQRTVFDQAGSTFHEGFADFFGQGAAHCLIEQEAWALKSLDHPHIVGLLDVGDYDGYRFIVTPRVKGKTLREHNVSRWAWASSKHLVSQLLGALEHLRQRRVVHRDLRPENILVSNVDNPRLTLIDFGLALVDGHGVPGQVGDSRYRAPECYAASTRETDHRADLYGAGVILYELLSGRTLFRGPKRALTHATAVVPDLETICPNVPVEVRRVIRRLLAKRPGDRYSSAREALADLRESDVESAGTNASGSPPSEVAGVAGRASAAAPCDVEAQRTRATTLLALGESRRAFVLAAHCALLSDGSAATLIPLATASVRLGRVALAQDVVKRLPAAKGKPTVENLRELAYALLDSGHAGTAVSVALFARQCHDDSEADAILREVSGALAASWAGDAGDLDTLLPLCIACTQIALALAIRGDSDGARRFFARAVEVGRTSILTSPDQCSPELALHLAIAEGEVGNATFADALRRSVFFSSLLVPRAGGHDGLAPSHAAGTVIALMVARQTRLAAAFVRTLKSRGLGPQEIARLERMVELSSLPATSRNAESANIALTL